MKTSRTVLGIGVALAVLEPWLGGYAQTNTPPVNQAKAPLIRSSIPYVATRHDAVQDMLWMANVGNDDVVYDLGSGDGRIVIAAVRDFGARQAVGVEIDPARIQESRENAKKAGVTDRVEFIQGDLFTIDFRPASVVTLFLGHEANFKFRPKIFSMLKPGTRIVSHQFAMGEWQPDKALTVHTVYLGMWGEQDNPFSDNPRVPDFTGNEMHFGTSDKISMWVVPAPIAGIWRGKIETARGPLDFHLHLNQRLAAVTGSFRLSGQTNLAGSVWVDLWGSHLRFWCKPDHMAVGQFELRFDGQVNGNTMQGTLAVTDHGEPQERAWEAHRDKADLTGTWEWPCATGARSVRLRIEQGDGCLTATYQDGALTIPVTDFYDYGGGIYFTLLIGREKGGGLRITEETGWLIGQAVVVDGELKGTIEFHRYKYAGSPGDHSPSVKEKQKGVYRSWEAHLIKP